MNNCLIFTSSDPICTLKGGGHVCRAREPLTAPVNSKGNSWVTNARKSASSLLRHGGDLWSNFLLLSCGWRRGEHKPRHQTKEVALKSGRGCGMALWSTSAAWRRKGMLRTKRSRRTQRRRRRPLLLESSSETWFTATPWAAGERWESREIWTKSDGRRGRGAAGSLSIIKMHLILFLINEPYPAIKADI